MVSKKLAGATALVSFVGAVMLAVPGCGSGSDSAEDERSLCRGVIDAQCDKLYECASASVIAEIGLPTTVAGCKAQLLQERGCDAADTNDTCEGSEVFKRANAQKCMNQLRAASCNQIESTSNYAPACEEVCVVE